MKVYTLGMHGFVTPNVMAALRCPRYHAQACVFIPANSKTEAAALSTSCGVSASARDRELTVAMGADLDLLTSVAIIVPGAIYILRLVSNNSPVIRLAPGGELTPLGIVLPGLIEYAPGRAHPDGPARFYPLPGSGRGRPELTPAELDLLNDRGYTDLWASWDQPAATAQGDDRV